MKRSRFTEEQIIAILKQQENGVATADVCREHGISSATWPAAGFVDTGLGLHSSALERHGAQVAQLRVASPRIVEAL